MIVVVSSWTSAWLLQAPHYGSELPDFETFIIQFTTSSGVSEQMSRAKHAREASSAEQMNKWVVRVNGQVSGPLLTSWFMAVLNHSGIVFKIYLGFFKTGGWISYCPCCGADKSRHEKRQRDWRNLKESQSTEPFFNSLQRLAETVGRFCKWIMYLIDVAGGIALICAPQPPLKRWLFVYRSRFTWNHNPLVSACAWYEQMTHCEIEVNKIKDSCPLPWSAATCAGVRGLGHADYFWWRFCFRLCL